MLRTRSAPANRCAGPLLLRNITSCATQELKFDGYRLQAVKSAANVMLYSRRQIILNGSFSYIAEELAYLPPQTVLDGELVALAGDGKPNFNLLQKFLSANATIRFFVFDILIHQGRELLKVPLAARRALLSSVIRPARFVEVSEASAAPLHDMLRFVRSQGPEGIVAKRGRQRL
jgi:ATP-dependent DNA ligase